MANLTTEWRPGRREPVARYVSVLINQFEAPRTANNRNIVKKRYIEKNPNIGLFCKNFFRTKNA